MRRAGLTGSEHEHAHDQSRRREHFNEKTLGSGCSRPEGYADIQRTGGERIEDRRGHNGPHHLRGRGHCDE